MHRNLILTVKSYSKANKVGFHEIMYRKGARKVKELVMIHLNFTPHSICDIIAVGIGVEFGVSGGK